MELHLGHRLTNLVDQGDTIGFEFANGRYEEADLIIGADGVRSVVRRFVTGTEDVVYSETSAFRGIVPTERLPSLPNPQALQFWMGPGAPAALRDRRQSGCGELSRRYRRSGSLAP